MPGWNVHALRLTEADLEGAFGEGHDWRGRYREFFLGGFTEAEEESGYADYLTSDESSCVPDPRGQTIGFARRPSGSLGSG
jgi:hypothetical protein